MKKDGTNQKGERGGFLLGMVVGLLLGLAISLGVALYVAKVPIPFIDKVPQRSAAEDEQDAQAHKNWNPNANLPGGTKRAPAASGVVSTPAPVAAASAPAPAATPAPAQAAASKPAKDAPVATAKASEPAAASAGGFVYFVQAGAFTQANDAEQQRAKLAMQGFNAKVYERASGDKTVFRVRIGPFDTREPADALIAQVQAAGMEAAVVRAQR